jgi:hypothetical protein
MEDLAAIGIIVAISSVVGWFSGRLSKRIWK